MSRTTDVLVAGSGLAGLMAAYAAAKAGARVKIVSEGMGNLSISPGCVDLLGYDAFGKKVADPWAAMEQLPPEHPYSLVGKETVQESLRQLIDCVGQKGCKLAVTGQEDGRDVNVDMPTIMGTFKPTWLTQSATGAKAMRDAKKVLIVSVKGFRDCRPQLIASQLARYPGWTDKDCQTLVLPAPFNEKGRSISALDLAHYADRDEGRDWLLNRLRGIGKRYDLALLPPMLGASPNSRIHALIDEVMGCPVIEMLSTPPGVGGLRIRAALVDTLVDMGAEFYENAQIRSAVVKDGFCTEVLAHSSNRDCNLKAKTFVIATGGIIGGGLLLDQGKATEAIFGLDVPVPADVDDWSKPEIFGHHLVSRLGIKTGADLRAAELKNVFFAGRILGGYDWASEKSGHGVACATGWKAGSLAGELALGEDR